MNIENELKDVFKDIIEKSDSSSKYTPICMITPETDVVGKMLYNLTDRFPVAISCSLSKNFIDAYIEKLSERKITIDGISVGDVLNIAKELVINILEICLYDKLNDGESCEAFLKDNVSCVITTCISCITFLERTHILKDLNDMDKTDFCILLISMVYSYSRIRLTSERSWRKK